MGSSQPRASGRPLSRRNLSRQKISFSTTPHRVKSTISDGLPRLDKAISIEMAQGTLKSKKLTTATAKSSGRRPNALGPKKGARTIAPRKQVLVRNKGMTKVDFFFPFF